MKCRAVTDERYGGRRVALDTNRRRRVLRMRERADERRRERAENTDDGGFDDRHVSRIRRGGANGRSLEA
jgi:hypothetical protein